MDVELQNYLRAITRKLRLDPRKNREIALELQGHLEERTRELEQDGLTYREALNQALDDLGGPDAIARDMYTVHSRANWRDILLATLPHLLLASLFALHLWTKFMLVAVILIGVTFVTLKGWRTGRPNWTYTWLGYSMAAPALSWLMALGSLAYGSWQLVTTGSLPFSFPIYMLMAVYVPFSLWIMARVMGRVIRQDWLLVSLTALPFPFLTTWMLFLNWQGGLWPANSPMVQATDTERALVFFALAVVTAVFLKVGRRVVKIALLMASTAVLVIFTVAAIPFSFGILFGILITLASVAFLLSPAILQSRLDRKESSDPSVEGGPVVEGEEVVTHWFTNAR